jgi:glycosyltransferase involved in cell wall biosynthesis
MSHTSMPGRLRLLWVTPDLPSRGVSAARERWWNLLSRLAPRHDITLLTFADPGDLGDRNSLPPGLARIDVVPRDPWRPDDPLALLPRTVAGGFVNPAFPAAIAARLATGRWDVVQYEFSEMAQCIPGPAPRTILTVHQVGFAQHRALWRAQHGGLGRAAVFLHRYLRDLDFELRALRRVDRVVTMSAEDAARLRRFDPDLPVSVSPCGVDCARFRLSATTVAPETDLAFVGHFGHPPNVDAVTFLVDQVLPRVNRPVRLRILGRGVTPDVAALARPGVVEITGAVDDVRPHLAAARIVVAPVRFGTGMRGKVLEALAMARPVVTTRLGAEGLGAVSGQHLLLADGADDFAQAVLRLLDDGALAARLGSEGRRLVERHFDWDAVAIAHEEIYERALSARGRAVHPAAPSPTRPLALVGRLGYVPGIAAGFALLATRAVMWHAQRLRRLRPPMSREVATLDG